MSVLKPVEEFKSWIKQDNTAIPKQLILFFKQRNRTIHEVSIIRQKIESFQVHGNDNGQNHSIRDNQIINNNDHEVVNVNRKNKKTKSQIKAYASINDRLQQCTSGNSNNHKQKHSNNTQNYSNNINAKNSCLQSKGKLDDLKMKAQSPALVQNSEASNGQDLDNKMKAKSIQGVRHNVQTQQKDSKLVIEQNQEHSCSGSSQSKTSQQNEVEYTPIIIQSDEKKDASNKQMKDPEISSNTRVRQQQQVLVQNSHNYITSNIDKSHSKVNLNLDGKYQSMTGKLLNSEFTSLGRAGRKESIGNGNVKNIGSKHSNSNSGINEMERMGESSNSNNNNSVDQIPTMSSCNNNNQNNLNNMSPQLIEIQQCKQQLQIRIRVHLIPKYLMIFKDLDSKDDPNYAQQLGLDRQLKSLVEIIENTRYLLTKHNKSIRMFSK